MDKKITIKISDTEILIMTNNLPLEWILRFMEDWEKKKSDSYFMHNIFSSLSTAQKFLSRFEKNIDDNILCSLENEKRSSFLLLASINPIHKDAIEKEIQIKKKSIKSTKKTEKRIQ